MGDHYTCAVCMGSPSTCTCARNSPPSKNEAPPSEVMTSGEIIEQQRKRIQELEYAVTNLHATQMEEIVRIGLARDSEREEAAEKITLLERRVERQEEDFLKNMGEIAVLRDAAGCDKEALARKIALLEDEISELQEVPWPAWAEVIYKRLREFGAIESGEEVDLGECFTEWLDGLDDCEAREDEALTNFRELLMIDLGSLATQVSKINQWASERQKRPSSDYLDVATAMLEITRKVRAEIRREETRRRGYYKPLED